MEVECTQMDQRTVDLRRRADLSRVRMTFQDASPLRVGFGGEKSDPLLLGAEGVISKISL